MAPDESGVVTTVLETSALCRCSVRALPLASFSLVSLVVSEWQSVSQPVTGASDGQQVCQNHGWENVAPAAGPPPAGLALSKRKGLGINSSCATVKFNPDIAIPGSTR